MGKRYIVVGTSGSGKTTLARQIAEKLNVKHIELDALHWDENWTSTPVDELKERLHHALNQAGDSWTIDGNYSKLRDMLWQQADTIIWLDYPRWLVYWRIITRTMKRVFLREELWGGNRETFRIAFLSKDSVILWAHQTYNQRKVLYSGLMTSGDYPHLNFLHFTTPQQTQDWLKSLNPHPDAP